MHLVKYKKILTNIRKVFVYLKTDHLSYTSVHRNQNKHLSLKKKYVKKILEVNIKKWLK